MDCPFTKMLPNAPPCRRGASLVGRSSALAQKTTPPEPQKVTAPRYPVVLGDHILFYVHGIKSTPGNERAAPILGRIKRLAEDFAFSADSITVADEEISTDILMTNRIIRAVFNADAKAEKVPRKELARRKLIDQKT